MSDHMRVDPDGLANQEPNAPALSVIVPAFNEERQIRDCLSSIVASSLCRTAIELIVVNNNSTDETAAIARQYADKVIDCSVQGAYEARNVGAATASADVLAFVDADCLVSRTLLADSVSAVDGGFVGGTCRKVPDNKSIYHRFIWLSYDFVDRLWMATVKRPYNFFAAFCFVSRSCFHSIGGFEIAKGVNSDHYFGRRLAECGPVAYLTSAALTFSVRRLARVGYGTYWMRTKMKRHNDYPPVR